MCEVHDRAISGWWHLGRLAHACAHLFERLTACADLEASVSALSSILCAGPERDPTRGFPAVTMCFLVAAEGGGARNGSMVRRRILGRRLRLLREAADLTLDDAAPKLDWSPSKLNRIEAGQ